MNHNWTLNTCHCHWFTHFYFNVRKLYVFCLHSSYISFHFQHFTFIQTVRNVKRTKFYQLNMKTVDGQSHIMIVVVLIFGCLHILYHFLATKMEHIFSSKFFFFMLFIFLVVLPLLILFSIDKSECEIPKLCLSYQHL